MSSEYYRPGHLLRPEREWEVWDERWLRGLPNEPREGWETDDRWVIHHPIENDFEPGVCFCDLDFPTLNDALVFIAQFEVDYAEELAEWRAGREQRGAA